MRSMLALSVGSAAALAACSASGPATPDRTIEVQGEAVAEGSLRDAVAGLCTALNRVPTDPMAARDAFYDLAHDRLHTIAAATQEVDRTAAGSLLQAKAVVEEDLGRFPFPSSLADDLDRLVAATRTALERLSIRTEAC